MHRAKAILLFAAIQLLLLASGIRAEMEGLNSLSDLCSLAMILVPFVGYIIVLYRAPMRLASSLIGRMAVLAPLSAIMTICGIVVGYIALAIAGMPIRG